MAKGISPQRQKQLQRRKDMYTPQQRAQYEPCPCDPKVPVGLFDDDNLNVSGPRPDICDKCFCVLTNGKCLECL